MTLCSFALKAPPPPPMEQSKTATDGRRGRSVTALNDIMLRGHRDASAVIASEFALGRWRHPISVAVPSKCPSLEGEGLPILIKDVETWRPRVSGVQSRTIRLEHSLSLSRQGTQLSASLSKFPPVVFICSAVSGPVI